MNPENGKRGGLDVRAKITGGAAQPFVSPPSHEDIASAAFGYWTSHGGDAKDNWLRCERQLKLKANVGASTPLRAR